MISVIGSVQNFLKQKKVKVPSDWVAACIEWLQSENSGEHQNIQSEKWLCEKAFEQWLFTDLNELQCASLPASLKDDISDILHQDITLQINCIREVGLPAYSQLQQLRKEDIENSLVDSDKPKQQSWEPKPSRMLLLTLTDGVTELKGMEYSSIPTLSLHIKPGTKLLVRSGTCVRRGVLLLTATFTAVMGGAVDSLLVHNAQENILCRALGLEETVSPREYEEPPLLPPTPASQASQYYPGTKTQNVACARRPSRAVSTMTREGTARTGTVSCRPSQDVIGAATQALQLLPPAGNSSGSAWNNSRMLGTPALVSVSAQLEDFADDDFLDDELEAALVAAEARLGVTSEAASFTQNTASDSLLNGSNECNNVSRKEHVNSVIDISRDSGAPALIVANRTDTNPFMQTDFTDDCFDDEDLIALEEKVSIIESQRSKLSNSSGGTSNTHDCVRNSAPALSKSINGLNAVEMENSAIISSGGLLSAFKASGFNGSKLQTNKDFTDGLASNEKNSRPLVSCGRGTIDTGTSGPRCSVKRPSGDISDCDRSGKKQTRYCSKRLSDEDDSDASMGDQIPSRARQKTKLAAAVGAAGGISLSAQDTCAVDVPPVSRIVHDSRIVTGIMSDASEAPVNAEENSMGKSVSVSAGKVTSSTSDSSLMSAVCSLSSPPFTYLCFLPDNCTTKMEFIVKGFVVTLVSRLDPSGGQWKLPVKINDGTRSLQVDIHDQVLRQLIGLSVPEMRAYKAKAGEDPSIRAMLTERVNGCQQQLISLCGLLMLWLMPGCPRPLLVEVTAVQDGHAVQLMQRCLRHEEEEHGKYV